MRSPAAVTSLFRGGALLAEADAQASSASAFCSIMRRRPLTAYQGSRARTGSMPKRRLPGKSCTATAAEEARAAVILTRSRHIQRRPVPPIIDLINSQTTAIAAETRAIENGGGIENRMQTCTWRGHEPLSPRHSL